MYPEYDVTDYRAKFLDVLKQTNNHYDTRVVDLDKFGKKFSYHKWLHPYQGDWELTEVFDSVILNNLSKIITPNSTVIDIGAQAGNMSVAYSLFAKQVLSFEPNPATFEVLEKNSQLNPTITPYNYAISDEEGALTFHYSDEGFCNGGFATRTEFGIGVTGHRVPIDVVAINFEKFVEENDIDLGNISLIKIDAEGHDKDILKTLKKTISEHKPVLITEIYTGSNKNEIAELMSVIHSMGYKIYDEDKNDADIDNLGEEVKTPNDINPRSGHNLICIHDS
jgi:FkbM family methyltransferase